MKAPIGIAALLLVASGVVLLVFLPAAARWMVVFPLAAAVFTGIGGLALDRTKWPAIVALAAVAGLLMFA